MIIFPMFVGARGQEHSISIRFKHPILQLLPFSSQLLPSTFISSFLWSYSSLTGFPSSPLYGLLLPQACWLHLIAFGASQIPTPTRSLLLRANPVSFNPMLQTLLQEAITDVQHVFVLHLPVLLEGWSCGMLLWNPGN
jgi:hypothetical protein